MIRSSQQELLNQQIINLEYCALLEKDGIVTLDQLSDLIPGYIHLNNIHSGSLEYVSKKALEIFEKSITDIRNEGKTFIHNISDKKSQQIFLQKKAFFLQPINHSKTYSYIQRLHYREKKIPPTLFYSTSKLYRDKQNCISYTQPLQLLQNDSFLKELVDKRYDFFNTHYYKYQLLTPRECEILKLIANGLTNQSISEQLFISIQTVKTHRKNICRKLETHRIVDFVKFSQVFLED